MYTRIEAESFRGLRGLVVDGLKRINLFVGRNNSGKTSLLEAVYLLNGGHSSQTAAVVNVFRGMSYANSPDAFFRNLFPDLDPNSPIGVSGHREGEREPRRVDVVAVGASELAVADGSAAVPLPPVTEQEEIGGLRITSTTADGKESVVNVAADPSSGNLRIEGKPRPDFVPCSLLPSRPPTTVWSIGDLFARLVVAKKDREVVEAVRLVDGGVSAIRAVAMNGQNRIMADTGGERLIPLAVTGDGMIKLFNISVLVAASEGGVVLIDEIDNGLHHSVMQPFWKALLKMATDHNVRILATTHNDELLRNAIEAFGDDLSVLGLYRLDRVGDRVEAVSYSEEALAAKRELDIEVRG
jgi:hypothetical protein